MAAKTTTKRYGCGVCGKQTPAEKMIYSRFTGARYCTDIDACRKRRKRGRAA